ncbi:thiopurine S-methyltransferase [Ectothiorhodospiraceae bacterium WFHF3C12]|nr:thiopurine S-methyltransferase [Ectothiorhodospiraceae bacterium WFHF3C12]
MERDFWLERWENEEIGFHQAEINPALQRFWPGLKVPAGGRVFVPLCGKSHDMGWLRERGHPIVGVELSTRACEQFFRERDLTPERISHEPFVIYRAAGYELWGGDFFHMPAEALTDVVAVYDRASLIALPPGMRGRYAAHMGRLVPGHAQVLLVSFEYPVDEMKGPPFSVTEREVRDYFGADFELDVFSRAQVLHEHPRFRARGLTRLEEVVYRLRRRG